MGLIASLQPVTFWRIESQLTVHLPNLLLRLSYMNCLTNADKTRQCPVLN